MGDVVDGVLRPLMRTWVSAAFEQAYLVPRPDDSPQVHRDGPDPVRILIFGGGIATGWGVRSHDLALPGSLARAVAARTGRGIDVDLATIRDMTLLARHACPALDGTPLWRYDLVVVTLGLTDAVHLRSPSGWRDDLLAIIETVRRGARPDTSIVFAGMQPVRSIPQFDSVFGSLAARRGRALNRVTEEVAAATAGVFFAPITGAPIPDDGRHRTPQGYDHWADELTRVIGPVVESRPGQSGPAFLDEADRQAAVDRLALSGVSGQGFDHVVALARRLFGTEAAAFSVIDGDEQWFKSVAGVQGIRIPRSETFCSVTIQQRGPMVVPDAMEDPRFSSLPLVTTDPGLRFYAGYPVTAPDGEPIGAICVFDTHARSADDVDVALLRRLALLVEAEIVAVSESRSVLR